MRMLITGATGFVGRNMMKRAVAHGWSVIAPVRNARKLHAVLVEEDINKDAVQILPPDPSLWPDQMPVDAALHSAGALFERYLEDFLATNVDWTLRVLHHIPPRCPTVVLSSLSAGGPTPHGLERRDESCPDAPVSAYGESKLRMERAIRREFPSRPIAVLRPPMILGSGDLAALQLFRMAGNFVRTKPGIRAKRYSFVGIVDLLDAVEAALDLAQDLVGQSYYVASQRTFSDWELIAAVAASLGRKGMTLPLPERLIRTVASLVDSSPALRLKFPSLTRDRVKEIWHNRWVIDPSAFENKTTWSANTTLAKALDSARDFYLEKALL